MSGPGRRLAVVFLLVAGILAGGRWTAAFVAERLWESHLANAVALAGMRRALIEAGLELGFIALTAGWFLLHFNVAARAALPLRASPGATGDTRLWPRTIPRWTISAAALVLGILAGSGGSRLAPAFQLMADGAPFGITDPLLEEDLGRFLGSFPFWADVQERAVTGSLVALGGAIGLYLAGGLIRRSGRRIRVSARARGHLAILVAVLALALAWGAWQEPRRLAAGFGGPIRHPEFLLQATLAYLRTGIGAAAAGLSLLWWARVRGAVAFLFWVMFGLASLGAAALPRHPDLARRDPVWRSESRRLDSVAFGLRLAPGRLSSPAPGAGPVTLWDEEVVVRSGLGAVVHRGWILPAGQPPAPVWFGLRDNRLFALSDDRGASSGAPLFWTGAGFDPGPALEPFRVLRPAELAIRPGAPRLVLSRDSGVAGLRAGSLPRRIILAWAWQGPGLLTAPRQSRVGWRLDPGVRLRSLAPFAHWSTPRIRWVENRLVWQSDGILVADGFPASTRVPWGSGSASLVKSSFMGVVDAGSGAARIFQREAADSLAAAWARISAPLIEPPSAIPQELRNLEPYPPELAIAQARVLQDPAWNVGFLDLLPGAALSTESPGGSERIIPYLRPGTQLVGSVLVLRRTPAGDSLRLLDLDSFPPVESAAALRQRWERFPYQQMVRDSVLAAAAGFRSGAVRYAITSEGPLAYEPAWAEGPAARPRLALVNLALGPRLGTGRTFPEALQNLRGEVSPPPVGRASQALLDEVRRWWQRADSALKRGDLDALGRALSQLRELLERQP